MNEKLNNVSSSELIDELIERKKLFKLDCGFYENWELKGKYDFHSIVFPKHYDIYLEPSIVKVIYDWAKHHDC